NPVADHDTSPVKTLTNQRILAQQLACSTETQSVIPADRALTHRPVHPINGKNMSRFETLNARLCDLPLGSLDQFVQELLGVPDLYRWLKRRSAVHAALFDQPDYTLHEYRNGSDKGAYSLHRTLAHLYQTHITTSSRMPVFNQFDPILLEVQTELERAWE